MKIAFTEDAWKDYLYWQKNDTQILHRINELLQDCIRSPFKGIGKPEPLRHQLSGFWSRRINQEHRLIYQKVDGELTVISVRFHYSKSK